MIIRPTRDPDENILCLNELPYWIDLYLKDCQFKLHRPPTLDHYRNALKRFSTWCSSQIDDWLIDRRNASEFAYWLSRIKHCFDDHPGKPTEERSLAPATVRRTVGVVRTFFTWLHNEGYLPKDFSYWFPFPKIVETPLRMVSTETLQAMFGGAASSDAPVRDTTVIALLADTGLRRQELTYLRVEQIQWSSPGHRGFLRDVEGKGERLRDVPFSDIVGEWLQAWLQQRENLLAGDQTVPQLFISRYCRPLHPDSIYQILKRAAQRGGVSEDVWNTHSFRHGFATNHWRSQRDTKSLSMILGHTSQKTTENYYVHPVSDDLMQSHTSVLSTGLVRTPRIAVVQPGPPSREQLQEAIQEMPNWRALGREFGMSDVGVRKMAQRYGLLEEYYQAHAA